MIGYVTLGTNDLPRAVAFYEGLAEILGFQQFMEDKGRFVGWQGPNGEPGVGITKPFDGQPASIGNGVMVALLAPSREAVDQAYAKALEMGGTDEGAPGQRNPDFDFYVGYFRDLDGNKLNVFCMPQG